MAETLEQQNAELRAAVESRYAGSLAPADPEPVRPEDQDRIEAAWAAVAARHREMQQRLREPQAAEPAKRRAVEVPADAPPGGLRPGSREFIAVLEELKALHFKKTLDYGADEDALANIRSSADVVNMPPWAGCILRMSDKMHRLKAFFRRGRTEFDGVEDTLKDLACYAAIALVLYRESCMKEGE